MHSSPNRCGISCSCGSSGGSSSCGASCRLDANPRLLRSDEAKRDNLVQEGDQSGEEKRTIVTEMVVVIETLPADFEHVHHTEVSVEAVVNHGKNINSIEESVKTGRANLVAELVTTCEGFREQVLHDIVGSCEVVLLHAYVDCTIAAE